MSRANLYFHLIGAADREWRANNVGRAEELLGECPPEARGWEWNYLERRNHGEQFRLPGSLGGRGNIVFSPDGRRIAATGESGSVRVWDADRGTVLHAFVGDDTGTSRVAFSADGRQLAVKGSTDVKLLDATSGRQIGTLGGGDADEKPRFGDADFRPFSGERTWDQSFVLDATTGQVLRENNLYDLGALSADGRRVARSVNNSTDIELLDRVGNRPLKTLRGHATSVEALAMDPTGQVLASTDVDGFLILWDTTDGTLLDRIAVGRCLSLRFSPDGKTLACSGWDRSIVLRDVATRREIRTLPRARRPGPVPGLQAGRDPTRLHRQPGEREGLESGD